MSRGFEGLRRALRLLSLTGSVSACVSLMSCELRAPPLEQASPLSQSVDGRLEESSGSPQGAPIAHMSSWRLLSLEQLQPLDSLRKLKHEPKKRRAPLTELPLSAQLCLSLGPGQPPSVAWAGSRSPALSIPAPPPRAEALFILMVDWDAPKPSQWPLLNETWRPLPRAQIERRAMLLWAASLSRSSLRALKTEREGARLIVPDGFGGRGWPLHGALKAGLSPLAYQGQNDYSGWFEGSPLAGVQLGYTGPCIPSRDPRPHQLTAFIFALTRPLDLPSQGNEALSAWALWERAAPLVFSLSRFDWSAQLLHDPKASSEPSQEELNSPAP